MSFEMSECEPLGSGSETRISLCFDVRSFEGPPVTSETTKVFGVPLPPGIRIELMPLKLEGWLDTSTGRGSMRTSTTRALTRILLLLRTGGRAKA